MAFQLNIKLSYIQLTAEDINQEKESTEWFETIQTVPSPTLEILKSYSGLKEDKIIPHIEEVRARAFKAWPYPYIGQLRFLYLNLSKHPYYETLLSRLRTGATFLDAGCYFGQDLRKLLLDGALASEALYGPDIDRAFLDLGYELFRDKANFHGSLLEVDILKDTAPVSALDDSRQLGNPRPGHYNALLKDAVIYQHDVQSFKEFWLRIGLETGSEWEVDAYMTPVEPKMAGQSWASENMSWIWWRVIRL